MSKNSIGSLTPRAFLIGIVCAVGICLITPYNNTYIGSNSYPSSNHLPLAPLFAIIILAFGLNGFLYWIRPTFVLTSSELAVIWCMMIVSVSIPSKAFAEYLLPTLVAPYYLATPENEWGEIFHQYLPQWAMVGQSQAVQNFYKQPLGEASIPWTVWLKPLMGWGAYALSLYLMMLCLCSILRKQWIEHERITFPLAQLPAQMMMPSEGKGYLNSFFSHPALWVGFSIAAVIHLINGLHTHLPVVPSLPTDFPLNAILTDKPWNALRPLPMHLQPSVIGVTFLLSLRVSFSVWFFFLAYKSECLVAAIMGIPVQSSPGEFGFTRTFASHQEMGAFIAMSVFLLWGSKAHLKNVLRRAFSKQVEPSVAVSDADEALSHRWAVWGFIAALCVHVSLSVSMGMSFLIAFLAAIIFIMIAMLFTWQVASAGILRVDSTFDPMMLLITTLGHRAIGPANFTVDAIQSKGFRTDISQMTMPHFMNAFKIADEPRMNHRQLTYAMIAAILICFPISCYAFLHLAYTHGAENLTSWNFQNGPRLAYTDVVSRILHPLETNWGDIGFILVGVAFTSFIMLMYHRFLWWPFHPIGCTTGSSWGIQEMFLSIFIGWLMKSILLRHGGLKGYRSARPFFLGLIMGEYTMGGVWMVVGWIVKRGYQILPN